MKLSILGFVATLLIGPLSMAASQKMDESQYSSVLTALYDAVENSDNFSCAYSNGFTDDVVFSIAELSEIYSEWIGRQRFPDAYGGKMNLSITRQVGSNSVYTITSSDAQGRFISKKVTLELTLDSSNTKVIQAKVAQTVWENVLVNVDGPAYQSVPKSFLQTCRVKK